MTNGTWFKRRFEFKFKLKSRLHCRLPYRGTVDVL
jgi:hypothetical protein